MKKLAIRLSVFLLMLSVACEYQNEETLFGNRENCAAPVAFSTQIAPIIQANCAVSGCHAAGAILPELTSFEKRKASAAEIKHETQSLHMPPPSSGKSLTQEEINLIACWVNQGAEGD